MKNRVARAVVRGQMRIWGAIAHEVAGSVPRPDGQPQAHAAGAHRARVLLVGSGAALGWGVRSHDLALPGSVARSLAALTARGVDVDLVAERDMTPGEVIDAIQGAGAHRFDAIIITVGFQAAMELTPARDWDREIRGMLARLGAVLDPSVSIVLLGIPVPRLDGVPSWADKRVRAHAHTLDAITAAATTGSTRAFVPADVGDEEFLEHAALGYARCGAALGEALAPLLRDSTRHGEWADSILEAARQAAVDEILKSTGPDSLRVRQLVEMTRSALGMDAAVFTVLDGTIQRHVARFGTDVVDLCREHSMCQHTIMESAGMIVEDALEDARFRSSPQVTEGDSPVRFYAGFPVESPDGYPVGALCVLDSRPHRAAEVNTVLLREFALLIQHELWVASRASAIPV